MAIRTTQSRRRSPLTTFGLLVAIALAAYIGVYLINLYDGLVGYVPKIKLGNTRMAPLFVAAQEVSEILFLPADTVHGWLDSERFELLPY